MKQLLLFFFSAFLVLFSCSQSIKYSVATPRTAQLSVKSTAIKPLLPLPNSSGKCFQKCIVPDRYETAWTTFPIYTGSDADAPVRVEKLLVAPARKVWVKNGKAEIALEQQPATFKEVRVLADTMFYRDFQMARFDYKRLVEKGGALKEIEVVCSEARTPNLILQVSAALKAYGYMNATTTQWDMKFSQAVQQFQKDSSLPVGDLNLETLQLLGI